MKMMHNTRPFLGQVPLLPPGVSTEEIELLCVIAERFDDPGNAISDYDLLRNEFENRMRAHFWNRRQILDYIKTRCPGQLVDLLILESDKEAEARRGRRNVPTVPTVPTGGMTPAIPVAPTGGITPPRPLTPGTSVATPGGSYDPEVCVDFEGQYIRVKRSVATRQSMAIVSDDRCALQAALVTPSTRPYVIPGPPPQPPVTSPSEYEKQVQSYFQKLQEFTSRPSTYTDIYNPPPVATPSVLKPASSSVQTSDVQSQCPPGQFLIDPQRPERGCRSGVATGGLPGLPGGFGTADVSTGMMTSPVTYGSLGQSRFRVMNLW